MCQVLTEEQEILKQRSTVDDTLVLGCQTLLRQNKVDTAGELMDVWVDADQGSAAETRFVQAVGFGAEAAVEPDSELGADLAFEVETEPDPAADPLAVWPAEIGEDWVVVSAGVEAAAVVVVGVVVVVEWLMGEAEIAVMELGVVVMQIGTTLGTFPASSNQRTYSSAVVMLAAVA